MSDLHRLRTLVLEDKDLLRRPTRLGDDAPPGGGGAEACGFDGGSDSNMIHDFTQDENKSFFTGVSSADDLKVHAEGGGAFIEYGDNTEVILENVEMSAEKVWAGVSND